MVVLQMILYIATDELWQVDRMLLILVPQQIPCTRTDSQAGAWRLLLQLATQSAAQGRCAEALEGIQPT